MAAELVYRVRAELPVTGELGEREQVLVSALLTGMRSARACRAYAGDIAAWLGWLTERGPARLRLGGCTWTCGAATQLDAGRQSPACARPSALSSFYRYCAARDLIGRVPAEGVAEPAVDPDYTATVGLDRDQARALTAADTGVQALGYATPAPGAFLGRRTSDFL